MNIIVLFLVAIGLFLIAGRVYPRYISRVYDSDDRRPTPAVELHDGRDYVETKPSVVFAHLKVMAYITTALPSMRFP